MKKFLSSLEERFVFPIGRRTWQILSLLGLLVLLLSALYFLLNSTPTGKDSVSVSKTEVIENRIDTTTSEKVTAATCELSEYAAWLDTIKADLPNSEWANLGDSSEPYETYVWDGEGDYTLQTRRDFTPNPLAIPNVLEGIYLRKGYDSSSVCGKISILKTLHALNQITEKLYLKESGIFLYAELIGNYSIDLAIVKQSIDLYSAIQNKSPRVEDASSYNSFMNYVGYLSRNKPSDKRINLVKDLLSAHKKLSNPKYKSSDYFDIAEIIFDSRLADEDLSSATSDFITDISFYDENGLKNTFKKYLNLYQEKLERAAQEQLVKKAQKAANRSMSLMAAGAAFLSIVSIATILLLFSIQSLLKRHVDK